MATIMEDAGANAVNPSSRFKEVDVGVQDYTVSDLFDMFHSLFINDNCFLEFRRRVSLSAP